MSKRAVLDIFDREAAWKRALAAIDGLRHALAPRDVDELVPLEEIDDIYEKVSALHDTYLDAIDEENAAG